MATRPPTSWFTVDYDSLAGDDGFEKFRAWQKYILARPTVRKLEQLVMDKVDKRRGRAWFYTKKVQDGSYNMVLFFTFAKDGPPEVVLRLPKPGDTAPALVAERLENEARWMEYMEERQVLKVPHVHSWDSKGPEGIGPYILMDFVEGEKLLDWLPQWTTTDDPKRDFVYEQLAEMYLQLHRQRFDRIGSVTRMAQGGWAVTTRPMTQDMHQQALGVPGFPTDSWPSGPLASSRDYKALVADLLLQQLRWLRNINIPITKAKNGDNVLQEGDGIDMERVAEIARHRCIARHAFAAATPAWLADNNNNNKNSSSSSSSDGDGDGFIVFNTDFHARNIMVDSDTGEITAVLDLEGTNALPAAFARDPPLWLERASLEKVLELDLFEEWLRRYQAILDRFLAIMERVEARQQHKDPGTPLSARMRASWESKECLVNFAAQHSDCFDALYWALPDVFPSPDESASIKKEVKAYQEWTRRQIALYETERVAKLTTER